MGAEDLGWLVIVAFWLLSGLLSQLKKKKGQEEASPPEPRPAPAPRPVPPPPPRVRQAPRERAGSARPGIAGSSASRPRVSGSSPPPPPSPTKPKDPLAELLKSFGVDVETTPEEPVASEHRRTAGEHSATLSETRTTASEHRHTPGWHERTASETRRTASEHAQAASERQGTAGEHVRGDVFVPDVKLGPPPSVRRRSSAFARRMVAGLRGDRESLARAIVLREVLGPPVGLRPPGERDGGAL